MAQQYISIKQVADNLYLHPLLQDVPFERIVNYAIDFSRLMGLPQIFEEKVAKIDIDNHRGSIPCDYYNVTQVKECKTNHVFTAASDSFFYSSTGCGPHTYKIQGNYIYTSIDRGEIEFAYSAIALDKDGFPLLPDNSAYTYALEMYIKKRWFTILFDMGKINPNAFQNCQQEYVFAAAQCKSDMSLPTVDEMETISRLWNRLLPQAHLHASGFVDMVAEEYRTF